ncbi:MAG: hypothetical protein ACYTGJ_03870 [Planctomycetota bacterium]
MQDQLRQVVRRAVARLRLLHLYRGASRGLVLGLATALLWVVAQRLFGLPGSLPMVLPGVVLSGVGLGALTAALQRRWSALAALLRVEQHHQLKQRLSTMHLLEGGGASESPELVRLLLADGEAHASRVDVGRAIPLERPRSLRLAGGLSFLLFIVVALLPSLDLLDREAERQAEVRERGRIEREDERLRERAAEMATLAEAQQISEQTRELLSDLARPRVVPKESAPREAVRRPLAELEELRERAELLKEGDLLRGVEEQVRALQGIDQRMETEFGRRAEQALSDGSPQRAAEALRKMAESLRGAAGDEREQLSRDLAKLSSSLGSRYPELSKGVGDALSRLRSGDGAEASGKLGESADQLQRLARLMRERKLLDSIEAEIEFTQDELAQLPREWKSGPPPKICPDCLAGTCQARSGGT